MRERANLFVEAIALHSNKGGQSHAIMHSNMKPLNNHFSVKVSWGKWELLKPILGDLWLEQFIFSVSTVDLRYWKSPASASLDLLNPALKGRKVAISPIYLAITLLHSRNLLRQQILLRWEKSFFLQKDRYGWQSLDRRQVLSVSTTCLSNMQHAWVDLLFQWLGVE